MSEEELNPLTDENNGLANRVVGDFRLLRLLGVGGMAEVYLAEQISLKRSVAVKILLDAAVKGQKQTLQKRFEQEARAAAGLSHPNIVQVFMTGQDGDLHYIVQEYVQGQNLSQIVKRNGPPDFLTGLRIMKHVAAALKAANDAGVVHRDIKPENIMLTHNGDAKVADFGLAQLNEPTQKLNLTQAGTTMGTPWYMSPEQIQGESLDHRTDQYSFGVTCYHMFAGQPPFPGKNSVSVAVKHLKEQPRPLSEHRRELPEGLCQIIHRMMEKQPEDRFDTPESLMEAIEALEDQPLRKQVADPNSFTGWLISSLPGVRMLFIGLAACVAFAFLVGRRVYEPVRLTAGEQQLSREDSAARQYAKALLPPRNEEAWRAVSRYFPDSDEAMWARLQLGVYHLSKPEPALSAASEAFGELLIQTSMDPIEWRDVRFLAEVGLTYIAEARGNTDERNSIVLTTLLEEYPDEFQEDVRAPQLLREYHTTLRDLFNPDE